MATPDLNRKAGSSLQRDVQREGVATLPHGRLTAGLAPDLDWDDEHEITAIDLRRRDVENGTPEELIGPEGWLA